MEPSLALERLHARARASLWLLRFTWLTRILLGVAFLPSGMTKLLGNRFTLLGTDTPIGFFFEALYQTGFYWRFIGLAQLTAASITGPATAYSHREQRRPLDSSMSAP